MRMITLLLWVIALVLLAIAYFKGNYLHIKGLKISGNMFIQVVPMLLAAFMVAGLIQVLIPQDVISHWLGPQTGLKGILIGSLAGAVTPGGPYVALPIALSFYKSGAGIGCIIAYLVGWTMWGIQGLFFELAILGPRLTLIKRGITIIFPPIAGLLAQLFAPLIKQG